jgi:hypothetical protein
MRRCFHGCTKLSSARKRTFILSRGKRFFQAEQLYRIQTPDLLLVGFIDAGGIEPFRRAN